MATMADITISFDANLKQFRTKIDQAQYEMKKFGKQMTSVGKNLSIGLTLPLTAFAVKSVQAFDRQDKALAQVRQGLISTGNAAKKSLGELETAAKKLQSTSLFGDEEILQGVTAQLLTFTNIAGTQFDRTQQAALDLATRLDGDLKSASIQLGKALNDPVANLSALSRSGIQFSKEQKATIKTLVETNRLADAQTVILDELQKQYGGAAAAAAKAGTGPFKQLSNQISDLTEDFGKIISEGLIPIVNRIKGVVTSLQGMSDEKKKVIVIVGAFAAVLGPLLITMGYMATNVVPGLIAGFIKMKKIMLVLNATIAANPIAALTIALSAAAAAFLIFRNNTLSAANATKALADARLQATKSVADERRRLERLIEVARDENKSKEQRLKAIEAINKISPEYLGNINLENINTKKVTESIEGYIAALNKKALAQAIEAKQQEAYNTLIENNFKAQEKLEQRLNNVTDRIERRRQQQQGIVSGGGLVAPFDAEADRKLLEDQAETEFNNALEANKKAYDEYVVKLRAAIGDVPSIAELIAGDGDGAAGAFGGPEGRIKLQAVLEIESLGSEGLAATTQELREQLTAFENMRAQFVEGTAEYDLLTQKIDFINESLNQLKTNFQGELVPEEFYNTEATDAFIEKMERLRELGELLSEEVASAFENFAGRFTDSLGLAKDGLQGFVGGLAKTVTKLISMLLAECIALAIKSGSISAAFTGPGAVFAQPAFIATAIGGVLAAFAAIPKFADGGIVSSPTLAMVGEYSGASNNPEVIAPLSKLRSMISDVGGQVFIPNTVLRGEDIVISYERTNSRNNRLR